MNQAATEIEMTRPVLTSVVATENNLVDQEMCFWLGTPWENKEVILNNNFSYPSKETDNNKF